MTGDGDARRARLGDVAVDAAHREAREAPAPSPALFDALLLLLAGRTARPDSGVAERDDVA